MLIDFTLGQTGIILRIKIRNSTTGQGLTGLTYNSSGLTISTICDVESSPISYVQSGGTISTIPTLGSYSATLSNCAFKEVDSANHKGIYELQIPNARFAVSGAKHCLVSLSGVASMAECDFIVPLRSINLPLSISMP